jgi:transposase-like protein
MDKERSSIFIGLILYNTNIIILFMGKRGPKPQFTDVACPNDSCEFYGLKGKDNVVGNGTSVSRGEKVRKYICRNCGKVFNDHTGTFYYDLRKEERVIELALKMSMKGMSEEGIADVLDIKPATVRRWLDRAAESCNKVNEVFMKGLKVPKIEMDEIWVIVQKKSSLEWKIMKMMDRGCG